MSAFHLLAVEYRTAALALADLDLDAQTVADTLESMSGDLEVKAGSLAYVVRAIEADAAALKEWAKTANERSAVAYTRARALRGYITHCMQTTGLTKIESPSVRLSFRASSAVVIDGADLIPEKFMRRAEAPPPEPDKALIKAALTAGEDVPGAHIEARQNLNIQ